MTNRLLALIAALVLPCLGLRADEPKDKPDPSAEPLPPGATVLYGVIRPILRTNPDVALLPPTYTQFVAPTMSGGVRRYDLKTGQPLQKVLNPAGLVGPGHVVVSGNGKRAAVSRPGSLTVVDTATGKILLPVPTPEGVGFVGMPGASLSADGTLLAFGSRNRNNLGEVFVWHVDRNEMLARFETAMAAPIFPTLSQDGRRLVTHGPPPPPPTLNPAAKRPAAPQATPELIRSAQVWDVENVVELFTARVTGMGGEVVAAAFSANGEKLAISAGDGPIDVYDVKTGRRLHTLLGRKGQGVKVAVAPNGKRFASVAPDYRIQMWGEDGTPIGVTEPPGNPIVAGITALEFADNERAIAWNTQAQFAVAWEGPTGNLLSPVMEHAAAIRSVVFPNDKDAYTSGVDGRVICWNRPTGSFGEMINLRPAQIPGQPLIRPFVFLSVDGKRATWPRSPAEVFDVGSTRDLFCIPPPSAPPSPNTVIVSADGLKVITLSREAGGKRNGACVVWDLSTQQRLGEFEILPSKVPPIAAMSPSGNRIVVGTVNSNMTGTTSLFLTGYDLKTGKKLSATEDDRLKNNTLLSAADERTAVLCSTDGRLWSVDYEVGQVNPDIDQLPTRGELAVYSPVAVSPDGRLFATGVTGDGLEDYGVRVYDLQTGKRTHTFMGHLGPVTALRFTPDGKALASGAQDTSVILWNLTKPHPGK